MKKLFYVLTISVLSISGCLSRSSSYQANYDFGNIDKIAIACVEGQVQNDNAKNQISNLFVMELLNKGYAPIPLAQTKAKVQALVDSAEIAEPPEGAYVQMGQALKVPAVLVINVPYFNNEIFVSAQLIDTKDNSVLWMDQDSGQSGIRGSLSSQNDGNPDDYLMDPLLMSQVPPGASKTQEETTTKPGEMPLTPRELQKIQIIVSRICSSLPSPVTNKPAPSTPAVPVTKTKTRTTSDW
jgi:hypothetical protein